MIMQAYHFPLCVSIFNFSLNPLVASQHPPLQREANPHKSLLTALRHCEEQGDEAIHKPQKVNTKNKKEKEFIIIYQLKELILNEILIFNFQFSISYTLFVSHFVGRQAKIIKQAYHFPILCFNF